MNRHVAKLFLIVLALGWLGPACATREANPSHARSNAGYVDLRADAPDNFVWEVAHYDESAKAFRKFYSEYSAPSAGVLRLSFAPGPHRLRITFLNRAIFQPAEVAVEIQNGQVTPVVVTLADAGDTVVVSKQETLGGTSGNLSGRRTRVQTGQADIYRLTAEAGPPVAYQMKEQMPYARR